MTLNERINIKSKLTAREVVRVNENITIGVTFKKRILIMDYGKDLQDTRLRTYFLSKVSQYLKNH